MVQDYGRQIKTTIDGDTFVCAHNGVGLTVESGYLTDTSAVNKVASGLQKILEELLGAKVHKLIIENELITRRYYYAYINIIAGENFSFCKEFGNFDFVAKGTTYATQKDKIYVTDRDSLILFPKAKDSIVKGNEVCILLEKK